MNTIKVLLIDNDVNYVNDFKKYFSNSSLISVDSYSINEKTSSYNVIEKASAYDLVLMDVIFPYIDGFTLIKELYTSSFKLRLVVIANFYSKEFVNRLSDLDVLYYMVKPVNFNNIERIIIDIVDYLTIDKYNVKELTNLLHNLGIPSHLIGYKYIYDIVLSFNNRELDNISNVYLNCSKKFNTSSCCVERSIRHAIEVGCLRANPDTFDKLFGYSIDIEKAKPTNKEFLKTIIYKIRG